jgi:hypothetical protein
VCDVRAQNPAASQLRIIVKKLASCEPLTQNSDEGYGTKSGELLTVNFTILSKATIQRVESS